jgi:glycerate kinase
MRVVVAPDKFKGSATALAVADALAAGIRDGAPGAEVVCRPVADGGDGTVDVLLAAGDTALTVPALDALGRPVQTAAAVRGRRAVVELARFAGLSGTARRAPLLASSAGLGVAVAALLERGFRDIVLGLGGSASTDGGLGLLLALGATATDSTGAPVTPDGVGLLKVASLDLAGIRVPRGTRLRVACDVDAPLAGQRGAARVFGPQKGATPEEVELLDAALARWGRLLARAGGREVASVAGAGAAGGIGAAGLALGGEIVRGAATVLDETGFDDVLPGAALVVTGEGSWDAQSLGGKAPAEVLARSRAAGVPAVLVAGRIEEGAKLPFAWAVSLSVLAGSEAVALAGTQGLLVTVGVEIGRRLPGWAPPPVRHRARAGSTDVARGATSAPSWREMT